MTEPFVDSEVDRTKAKWVADTFKEFGKPRATARSLFYFALSRTEPDYPICGGFVGEIRILRPYHECDGLKLPKWLNKTKTLGYVPADAILEEVPGENIFIPAVENKSTTRMEIWLNKTSLDPLLYLLCERLGMTLVSVNHRPSKEIAEALLQRAKVKTTFIFCLSDLSAEDFLFCEDLAKSVSLASFRDKPDIQIINIGLTPQQVIAQGIPMVPGKKTEKWLRERFKKYLKPFHLDHKRMAELDALEVYHPNGLSGFIEKALSDTIMEIE
ncbi:MAG: hypothetical protein MUO26_09700 [Methanotrichaceae archaeon]|nr:hypothetical protein [Methanotrichaceae archaeon]